MSTKDNRIYRSLADFYFFRIAVEVNVLDTFSHMLTKDEIKKTDRNKTTLIKEHFTLENWEDRKVKFFKQRMETYKEYLTDAEKINREINTLEKLQINTDDYKDLSDRYKEYLLNKLRHQKETEKPDLEKTELHPEIFKDNKFEVWQSMFDAFNITESNYSTDIDFMFEVMKYNNYIHSHIGLTNIRNWINEKYEISFEKIRYTNPNSNANQKRLAIFKEIISK